MDIAEVREDEIAKFWLVTVRCLAFLRGTGARRVSDERRLVPIAW
jgi:hypothetical protein